MRNKAIITALLAASCLSISAQEKTVPMFGLVQHSSPWLECRNGAGLYNLPVNRIVDVYAYGLKSDGGYKDLGESSNSIEGGILAKAYSKVGEKFCFYGNMGYSYFLGQKMGGPLQFDPAYEPIAFYEYPNDNPGQKTRELYTLEGALSYRVNENFSLGLNLGYQSGNYAKRKDPRNLDKRMDLEMSIGGLHRFSDNFALGADLRYRRTLESVTARTYGVTGENYFFFIDYGASMGKVEVLGSDNFFIPNSSERPMLNNFYGAAVQFEAGSGDISFFGELEYSRRSGSYGEKASSEILFTRHYGNILKAQGILAIRKSLDHRIKAEVEWKDLDNYINSFNVVSNPGENLEVEYFGEILTRHSGRLEAGLDYELLIGGSRIRPAWRINLDAKYASDGMKACYYPYLRRQKAEMMHIGAAATRSITAGKNIFEIGLEAAFKAGWGVKAEDEVLVEVSGPKPRTAQDYLDASWEFRTAPAVNAGLSFHYIRSLSNSLSIYVGINEKFGSLMQKPEYLESSWRNSAKLSAGLIF